MHKKLVIATALGLCGLAQADIVPYGMQSYVSQATVDSWGWSECHRSALPSHVAFDSGACAGTHMAMGVWNKSTLQYDILGAGAFDVVNAGTYANAFMDEGGTALNNWSNGLNFYRVYGSHGAWGFTTIDRTQIGYYDQLLQDGLQSINGQVEVEAARGLSFWTSGAGGSVTGLWFNAAFNVTGYDMVDLELESTDFERVFFSINADLDPGQAVPEPGTLALASAALGAAGLSLRRRTTAR